MKVQDHSSTLETKNVQEVSIQPTSKFTSSTPMVADRQRTGKKTLDLRGKKARIECMTQEETISKIEEATPAEAEVEGGFKKSLCTACFTRKILIIGQEIVLSSSNLKRRWPKSKTSLRHQAQLKKSITHPTGTNLHNHHSRANLHTITSALAQNTSLTTTDILHSTTSCTITRHTQAKYTHHNQQSLILKHFCK
jgi:hypothetical protein